MCKVNEQLFVINAFIWQHLDQFDYFSFVKVEEGQDLFIIGESDFIYQFLFMDILSKLKQLNINHCILRIIINVRAK
jgi:hypothetical protein